MRSAVVLCMVALFCLTLFCVTVCSADPVPAEGKVTLLDLESDCLPCELQDRIIRRVEQDMKEQVAFVYLDVEKETWAKEKYAVKVLPTIVLYDRSGKEVFRTTGYLKEKMLRDRLTEVLAQ